MINRITFIALCAAVLFAAPALAQDETPADRQTATEQSDETSATLLPQSINLQVVDGSSVPDECHYPETINDPASFELACVTMPRFGAGMIGAEYLAQLGRLGWQQGNYVEGGMTAVRTDENNCQRVLNIFPSDYPPGEERSTTTVVWFVLERAPRCAS